MKKLILFILLFFSFNQLSSAPLEFYKSMVQAYEFYARYSSSKVHEQIKLQLLRDIQYNYLTYNLNDNEIISFLNSKNLGKTNLENLIECSNNKINDKFEISLPFPSVVLASVVGCCIFKNICKLLYKVSKIPEH